MSTSPDVSTVAPTVSLLRQYLPMILVVLTTLGGAVGVAPAMGQQRANEVAADVATIAARTSVTVDEHARRIDAMAATMMSNDVAQAATFDAVRRDIRDLSIQVEALRVLMARQAGATALQRAVDRAEADEPPPASAPVPLLPEIGPAPRLPISSPTVDGGP